MLVDLRIVRSLSAFLFGCFLVACGKDNDEGEDSEPVQVPDSQTADEPCYEDKDGDGFCGSWSPNTRGDCDDLDAKRNADAKERLNAIDDNCNGTIDEGLTTACPLTLEEPTGGCETALTLVVPSNGACALTTAGRVLCWGSHVFGTPDVTTSTVPIAVPGISGATALVGSYGTPLCALVGSDAICWNTGVTYPIRIPLPDGTIQIAVTTKQWIFALDEMGQSYSRPLWPAEGESPEFLSATSGIWQLVGGNGSMCWITAELNLQCDAEDVGPIEIAPEVTWASAGHRRLCYLAGGELYCGPAAGTGELVAGNGSAIGVASGDYASCAFNAAGKLSCWHGGPDGVEDAYGIALGRNFGCILHKTGRISCWGSNESGQLGDGSVKKPLLPSPADPVSVYPGPEHSFPHVILLADPPRGSCDNLGDVSILRSPHVGVHNALRSCESECADRLDAAECYAICATNPGLSSACFECFLSLASCQGSSCYPTFNDCAGYPVDFVGVGSNEPRFECEGALCTDGASVAEPCDSDTDCATGQCVTLWQAPDARVCAAADGTFCSGRSPYCECTMGSQGGYCGGCEARKRTVHDEGDCRRSCHDHGDCGVGQSCFRSASGIGYCGFQ